MHKKINNKSSSRVLEKNGFVKTSEVKECHPLSNTYRNSLIYILINKNIKLLSFIPISGWKLRE